VARGHEEDTRNKEQRLQEDEYPKKAEKIRQQGLEHNHGEEQELLGTRSSGVWRDPYIGFEFSIGQLRTPAGQKFRKTINRIRSGKNKESEL
jgi:hypothetical protein